jgi:hypothetical protein
VRDESSLRIHAENQQQHVTVGAPAQKSVPFHDRTHLFYMGEYWRAWVLTGLTGDWHYKGRDIGWAEAVGFELLACTFITLYGPDKHFECYGDNTSVVEGWWKGASRNAQTNTVFRRLHDVVDTTGAHFQTRYANPAQPSRRALTRHPRPPFEPNPPPSLSPMLFGPTFETRQSLQLGLGAPTHRLNTINNAAMMGSDTPSADTSRESARKSQLPQHPGTTPNCLQALLAKKNADRARISPHPTTLALPPLRPCSPAKA